jgi:NADH:ubiquinone reductase (H+-translocating)
MAAHLRHVRGAELVGGSVAAFMAGSLAATLKVEMSELKVHRVVVVGGGFGGLQAVLKLRRAPVGVTLVDRRNFHLFQPLTYQVATGALSPGEIAYPIRAIFKRHRNVRVILAEVVDFDLEAQMIHLRPVGGVPAPGSIPYDTLIVAGGSRYSYFGHDEWSKHAAEVKSLESALIVRSRLLSAFEAAEQEADPALRAAQLTFVVVGAGPTGVEMAGQIAELARDTLRRDFRTIDPRTGRIVLVEAADRILTSFPPTLSRKAERSLKRLGVTVLMGRTVVGVDAEGVTVDDGSDQPERIPTRTVIWAAGVTASPLASRLAELTGAERDRAGRVTVEPDLTLPGHPEVFAPGDMVRGARRQWGGRDASRGRAGRHAAGPPRGEGRAGPAAQPRNTDLSLPRQGKPCDHRTGRRRRRHQGAEAERFRGLDHLASRPPLVPRRFPKPDPRHHPLVVQLRDARPRRTTDHRVESGAQNDRASNAGLVTHDFRSEDGACLQRAHSTRIPSWK